MLTLNNQILLNICKERGGAAFIPFNLTGKEGYSNSAPNWYMNLNVSQSSTNTIGDLDSYCSINTIGYYVTTNDDKIVWELKFKKSCWFSLTLSNIFISGQNNKYSNRPGGQGTLRLFIKNNLMIEKSFFNLVTTQHDYFIRGSQTFSDTVQENDSIRFEVSNIIQNEWSSFSQPYFSINTESAGASGFLVTPI